MWKNIPLCNFVDMFICAVCLQPLALVAWGCRLLMSDVNPDEVQKFIREKGLKGPEVREHVKMTSTINGSNR